MLSIPTSGSNESFVTFSEPHSSCSLVLDVEDLLFATETAISALEFRLVEWLGLVEVVPVAGPDLVSVQVLLSPPRRAVPALTIALVAAGKRVTPLVDLQFGTL